MKSKGLIQVLHYRSPNYQVKTINGMVSWFDYLYAKRDEMNLHGRIAIIQDEEETGYMAIFADDLSADYE